VADYLDGWRSLDLIARTPATRVLALLDLCRRQSRHRAD
jgi:hypothetical protein